MTRNRTRLYAGAAAGLLAALAAGYGLAKLTDRPAPAAAQEHEEDGAPAGQIALTPQAITAAGVQVQPVTSGGLSAEILAQVSITAAPNGQALLTAHASGTVVRVFKRLGDPVRAGETLAVVESREAAQIAADRSVAGAKAAQAQRVLERERSLYEQGVSPRADYEQARADAAVANAEAGRAHAAAGAAHVSGDGRGVVVASPISGHVTAAAATLGAYAQPDTELFRVADPAFVQIEAQVGALDAARIAPGDRAVLETADGRTLEGRVRSLTPTLNAESRSATAVLEFAATGLRPGDTARARLFPHAAAPSSGVVVPEEAVQSVGGRDVVFVRTPQGFRAQPVTVGRRSAGRVEVASGLQPGAVIATRNAFLLKAELSKGEGGDEH